jgi:hypothetical protein
MGPDRTRNQDWLCWQDPKPRLTLLARTSSNLTDWPIDPHRPWWLGRNKSPQRRFLTHDVADSQRIFWVTFSFIAWDGVRLRSLCTSAIVPVLDDRRVWSRRVQWDLAGKTEVLGEHLPQCHFVTNPTWPDMGSFRDRGGRKPGTSIY